MQAESAEAEERMAALEDKIEALEAENAHLESMKVCALKRYIIFTEILTVEAVSSLTQHWTSIKILLLVPFRVFFAIVKSSLIQYHSVALEGSSIHCGQPGAKLTCG